MSLQSLRQASARTLTGTSSDYNSDMLAMFALGGFTTGTFNERFLLWLNGQLGVTHTSLPGAMAAFAGAMAAFAGAMAAFAGAMAAFAAAKGASNWSSLGTFTLE